MGRRLTKEQLARRQRWRERDLPRVRGSQRPNNEFITEPQAAAVLQHVADGLTQVLMARPLRPFAWLADYLRHACKVAYAIEQDAGTVLVLEMHKKRRILQHALLATRADDAESKRLIRLIIALQQDLSLPLDELRLREDDLAFLATETPRHQSQWSVNVNELSLPPPPTEETVQRAVDQWVATHTRPLRHVEEYTALVVRGVTQALIALTLAAPEQPAEFIVRFFQQHEAVDGSGAAASNAPQLQLLFKTNYELLRTIDAVKRAQKDSHWRRERLEAIHTELQDELALRQRFIDKLRTSQLTTRTHAIMDGTPLLLNGQRLWVAPGALLLPSTLTAAETTALARAERFVMEEDERRWRYLLVTQRRYDAATHIQAAWKCCVQYRAYQREMARRRRAAFIIQRNYFHYLYHRAIRLPVWCVLGREVVVAPSVAQKCAIRFQFYPKKDFPTGNYKRLDGLTVVEMMELCRQDEACAGFSTDGALKRFVPRKLSQLQDMRDAKTMQDGLYVKTYPAKTDVVVNTAVVTAVPVDRFGLVTVVLDGTCVEERVLVTKLSDRWKKIRIRHRHAVGKPRRAFVFGGKQIVDSDADVDNAVVKQRDFDVLEDEDEEDAERRRRRLQSNEQEAEDPLLDYVFEDQSTKEIRKREPHCTYTEDEERNRVIAQRKRQYDDNKDKEYERKKVESAVRLQCAWRSKRARDAFRQVLALRAKEKEREKLVSVLHYTNQQKMPKTAPKKKAKHGFFSRWMQ